MKLSGSKITAFVLLATAMPFLILWADIKLPEEPFFYDRNVLPLLPNSQLTKLIVYIVYLEFPSFLVLMLIPAPHKVRAIGCVIFVLLMSPIIYMSSLIAGMAIGGVYP